MTATPETTAETYSGRLLAFTIPARHARGRIVRLDETLDTILAAHDYPAPITHLLGEALVLAVLMGGLVKDDGSQVTMQAQTESGAVNLLVCDYKGGELRGYVDFDEAKLAELGANPSLFALFGKGYLAITFDLVGGQGRYQGIVPLEGDSLTEACERYFHQSEQVPTLIRCAVRSDGSGVQAAGLLVQHLPEGEEGRERLHAKLDEAIAWRLFHEEDEIRIEHGAAISRGCRCSVGHYRDVLSRFPEEQRAEMRDDDGIVFVDCAFCSKQFGIEV